MKHLENREFELEELKQELELSAVPEAVERKLRQVYAELPEELPTQRHPLRTALKTAACTAASLIAAFLLMFGVNAVNPAFAESIPGIGNIFQRINDPGPKNMEATQLDVQRYAAPVEDVSQQVPAAGLGEKPMTVTVREAYFDGAFLYAGLDLEVSHNVDWMYNDWVPGYDVLFNGEQQRGYGEDGVYNNTGINNHEGFVIMGTERWQRDGSGHYISQQIFRVPEEYQDLDSLEVTLGYHGILSREGLLGEKTINSTPFTLTFTAQKNEAQAVHVDGNGLEMGGVRFVSAAASPAGTTFTMDVPDSYNNPAIGWQFDDGRGLGNPGQGRDQSLEDGMTRRVFAGSGIREDEDRLFQCFVFDRNDSSEYVAVFRIDFQAGTVSPGSEEDLKHAPSGGYACGWDTLESFTEGYKVARVFAGENKNLVYLVTPNKYREIRAEVYQDGELLGSVDSQHDEQEFYHPYRYWQYSDTDGEQREDHETDLSVYQLSFGTDLFDLSKDVTVKIYDAATEEELHEETFSWNQPNP